MLNAIPPGIMCNVHLSDVPGLAAQAARAIVEMGRVEQCILACTRQQAAEARAVAPGLRICNMSGPRNFLPGYVAETIDALADFIQVRSGLDGLAETVRKLHAHGITVNYFGAQEESLIEKLVEAGVDYILTDDLDLCLSVVAKHGVQQISSGGGVPAGSTGSRPGRR